MIQNYINHIALVVDNSGSMSVLRTDVVRVFDNEIEHLKKRSIELHQETRISAYLFGSKVKCLVFDMDVMRMTSLKEYYKTEGSTALIDGTLKAVADMKKLPELYGDHAFLVYVMTDGQENASILSVGDMVNQLKSLPDNWTMVCLVPDSRGQFEAKKFGFPIDNIQVWSTTSSGVEEVGKGLRSSLDSYMIGRSQGQRSTKSFFKTDLSGVSTNDVKKTLDKLPIYKYKLLFVDHVDEIKTFVEGLTNLNYVKGSAYYELTKTEIIQSNKEICVQDKVSGEVFGGKNARHFLGLPDTKTRVHPGDHGQWIIFVQSNSVNRKLEVGTRLLVMC